MAPKINLNTEIVDKTGTIGVAYKYIETGRAFKVDEKIYVMTDIPNNTNSESNICVEFTTGKFTIFDDDTTCYLVKLKIYITKMLAD